jgi:DNA-binding beta-propeller fold protein YncE
MTTSSRQARPARLLALAAFFASMLPLAVTTPEVQAASPLAACSHGSAARLSMVKGAVRMRHAHGKWSPAKSGAALRVGDQVRTSRTSRASVSLCGGGAGILNHRTQIVIASKTSARMTGGEVEAVLRGTGRIQATKAAAASTGGQRATVDIEHASGHTTVTAVEGTVHVTGKQGSVTLVADQQTKVNPKGAPQKPVAVDAAAVVGWANGLTWSTFAQFSTDKPTRMAVDSAGNAYVTEEYAGKVVKLSPSGKVLTSWSTGNGGYTHPLGIAVDSAGNVYVADTAREQIIKYSSTGSELAAWGSYGSEPGQFNYPAGVALDSAGNIYVADTGNHRVQKLSPTGAPLAQWGTAGLDLGQFRGPIAIALDRSGNIYVADWGDADFFDRIIKLSPSGQFMAQWGGKQGSGLGQINTPEDIAVDGNGTIYVAEGGNARIQEFSSQDGHPLGILGVHGAGPGQFSYGDPTGLAFDSRGRLYVVEEDQTRIERYAPGG